jgi:ATP-dependent DNA ligase
VPDREQYNNYVNLVQEAYDVTNDFSIVVKAAMKHELDKIKMTIGKPIKVMLAIKAKGIEEGLKQV